MTEQTDHNVRAKLFQDFSFGTSYVSYLPPTTPLLPYPNNAEFSGYALEPNYYLFRRFFEADRTRGELKAGSSFDVAQALSLEFSGRKTKDDYTHSAYGITGANSCAADADLAYTGTEGVDVHGFYTYESIASDQTSLASTGIVQNIQTSQWTWNGHYQDRVHTFGAGATWDIVEDVFKVGPRFER